MWDWNNLEDIAVNGAIAMIALMIGYLLWDIRASDARRRRVQRDKDRSRWQDQ
jgi:hypothetical protein